MRSRYLLDSEDWNGDVIHWTVPSEEQFPPDLAVAFAFVNGFAAAQQHDLKATKEYLEVIAAVVKQQNSRPLPPGASPSPQMKRVAILHQELEALIDAAEGRQNDAIASLRDTAAKEDTMAFEYGPPFIDKPPEELLGEVLLKAGNPGEARAAFDASLARAPGRTQSLAGLSRALKASGDTSGSEAVIAKLHAIWHNADEVPCEFR